VSVLLPPLVTDVGDAENDTVGAGIAAVTVTEAVRCVVPPEPLQLNVYDALEVSAPVLCEPEVDFEPLQLPEAVHDDAFDVDQVSVLLPPLLTEVGEAEKLTVGAVPVDDETATVTFAWREPPAPEHVSTYVGLVVNAPVLCEPDVATDPLQLPEALHEVALVELHVSVLLPPLLTDIGDAESETVGAGVDPPPTVTVTLSEAVRPLPLVHVSVNVLVALNAPVLCDPEVAFCPLQPPDAVHDAARDVVHVSVLLAPALTEPGLADRSTVGPHHDCACAGAARPLPKVARSPASASGANRIGDFMGGDHRHNITHTVCLQTATC
jgi:hypothetical protein